MSPNRKRANQIIVRMNDDEYAAYQRRLDKANMSGNSFAIYCLLNHHINVIMEMPELIRQLKAIGNNLNQIARTANSGFLMPPNIRELQKGVDEIWQWLKRAKAVGR